MKAMKKFASLALALVMALALAIPALAVEGDDTASITIEKAGTGATYTLYKLFDAEVDADRGSNTANGITYNGDIPTGLEDVFEKSGNTIAVKGEQTDADVIAALTTWATSDNAKAYEVKSVEGAADGTAAFDDLTYGYYLVTSSVGTGSAIVVTSIAPNATIVEKNTRDNPEPGDPNDPTDDGKKANGTTFDVGETVTYTLSLQTVNYNADGDKVISYTISDTLPTSLTNVNVTKITVDGEEITTQQFNDKKITINWVDAEGNFIYDDGALLQVEYTAVVAAAGESENRVTFTYQVEDGEGEEEIPGNPVETIYSSTITVTKIDGDTAENENPKTLAGATFILQRTSDNKYYKFVEATETTPARVEWVENETDATQVTTGDDGVASFSGLKDGSYKLIETEAPAGYNKLAENENPVFEVKAADVDHEVVYGNSISNYTGAVLPSTGGIGTTIFYVGGGILVVGAAILLITKKRMSTAE